MNLSSFLKSNKRAGTPLLAISTYDQPRTEKDVCVAIGELDSSIPLVRWTCLDGFYGLNKTGETSAAAMVPTGQDPSVTRDLVAALVGARGAPDNTVIIFWNLHRFLEPQIGRASCRERV